MLWFQLLSHLSYTSLASLLCSCKWIVWHLYYLLYGMFYPSPFQDHHTFELQSHCLPFLLPVPPFPVALHTCRTSTWKPHLKPKLKKSKKRFTLLQPSVSPVPVSFPAQREGRPELRPFQVSIFVRILGVLQEEALIFDD